MVWANSKIFAQTVLDILANTTAMDLNGDTFKIALFDNTITPSNTVAAASSAYNTGVWLVAAEQDDGTNWDAAGEPLTSVTLTTSAGVVTFDAANTSQGGASTTLTGVHGHLCYSDTIASPVADQGLCYNYYGGAHSVVAGDFTVQHSASGICDWDLS